MLRLLFSRRFVARTVLAAVTFLFGILGPQPRRHFTLESRLTPGEVSIG